MKTDFDISFEAVCNRSRYVGAHVTETVLTSVVHDNGTGKDRAVNRTLFRIVWRRVWPFTWCHVRFRNGKVKASGTSVVLAPFGSWFGSALMNALAKAGFRVKTNGEETKPWRINDQWIENFAKTIGFMFRKDNEFVTCRRTYL